MHFFDRTMPALCFPRTIVAAVVLAATVVHAASNPYQPCNPYPKAKGDALKEMPSTLSPSSDFKTWTYGDLNAYQAYSLDTFGRRLQLVAGSTASPRNVYKVTSYVGDKLYYTLNSNDACAVNLPLDPRVSVEKIEVYKVADY